MDRQLTVSSSPHIRGPEDTRSIMFDVIIALAFALALPCFFFGWRVAILTAVSVVSCVLFEWLYRKALKKTSSIRDLSAVVTGMLLAYCLPPSAPYWLPVIGGFFAIVIVKQLYGGIGKNFLNPALAARAFLTISFPAVMTVWTMPFSELPLTPVVDTASAATPPVDAVSVATPLMQLKEGALPDVKLIDMLLGQRAGSLGEVSALILLLGGLYLVLRRVISPRIPLLFMGTVALMTVLFPPADVDAVQWMLYNLLSGGLVLGAVFMATDYATSPVTVRGQVLYAVGCGLLTVFFRTFSSSAEGVCFAILLMNTLVWALDKVSRPRRFGVKWFARKMEKRGEAK